MRYVDADRSLERAAATVQQGSTQLRELAEQAVALVTMLAEVDLSSLSSEIDARAASEGGAWMALKNKKDAISADLTDTQTEAEGLNSAIRGRP